MGLTTALLIGTAALGAGSSIMKSRAAISQAKAEEGAAKWNAQAAEQRGAYEEERLRRKARRALSRQRVQFAKSGATLEGSPLEVLAQNAAEFELDAVNARIQAQNVSRLERARGKQAMRSGRARAGAELLSGIAGLVGTGLQMKPSKAPTPAGGASKPAAATTMVT